MSDGYRTATLSTSNDKGGNEAVELLVAAERVAHWMSTIRASKSTHPLRLKFAVTQLSEAVKQDIFAEEARKVGAAPAVTRLLGSGDEAVLDAAAKIIARCSGDMACGGRVVWHEYGSVSVCVKEGSLGEGIGVRVWSVAHVLSRELAQWPRLVSGLRVLEIGSGCGVCGIVAASLGAKKVTLTDAEPEVLSNLRQCMHLNSGGEVGSAGRSSTSAARNKGPPALDASGAPPKGAPPLHCIEAAVDTSHTFSALSGPTSQRPALSACPPHSSNGTGNDLRDSSRLGGALTQCTDSYQAGNMCVRRMDWLEELAASLASSSTGNTTGTAVASSCTAAIGTGAPPGGGAAAAPTSPPATQDGGRQDASDDLVAVSAAVIQSQQQDTHAHVVKGHGSSKHAVSTTSLCPDALHAISTDLSYRCSSKEAAPDIDIDTQYDVVIGSDVLYEPQHARLVAAVVQRRLAAGGHALLALSIREKALIESFRAECHRCHLQLRERCVVVHELPVRYGGIIGREEEYEGGFLIVGLEHEAAPAAISWQDLVWDRGLVTARHV